MNREPQGIPTGGQFAATARAETTVELATAHRMDLTPATHRVLDVLHQAGAQPYLVGGCVRDSLMGGSSKDVDIEVYGADTDTLTGALEAVGKVSEVGKSFGIIKVRSGGEEFDVSLPRADSRNGTGHRGFDVRVDPDMTHEEATARRDFTINAFMYDPAREEVLDYHGGLDDLRDGVLRHVSPAFAEDPLRVLRGVRFAARFDMTMHPDTIEFSRSIADQYATLPIDRVQKEFARTYAESVAIDRAFDTLRTTGWQENLPGLPEVNTPALSRQLHQAQKAVDGLSPERRNLILASVVAHPMTGRDAFLTATTLGGGMRRNIHTLTSAKAPVASPAAVRAWAAELKGVTIEDWAVLHTALGDPRARGVLECARAAGVSNGPEKLILSGHDIVDVVGRPPGPWLSGFMKRAAAAQYDGQYHDLESARRWAQTL